MAQANSVDNVLTDIVLNGATLGGNLVITGFNIGAATDVEIGYLSGVTSAIQAQLNAIS